MDERLKPVTGKPTPEQVKDASDIVEFWAGHYDGEFSTSDEDRKAVQEDLDFVLSVLRSAGV